MAKERGGKGPQFTTRPAWLTSSEQRLYQLEKLNIGEQPPDLLRVMGSGARAILVQDVWYEMPLGQDWIAAYRLSFQDDRSRLVIGELRIFPARGPRAPFTGQWLADVLGSDAPVPAGGLTARTVRQATMRGFVPYLEMLFRHARVPFSFATTLSRLSGSRRGRPPKPAAFYATVALLYERSYMSGSSRPTSDVARALSLSQGAARASVKAARQRGFLTRTERGRASGRATDQARQLVSPNELQRLATKGKTGGNRRAQSKQAGTKKPSLLTRGKNRA